MYRIKIFIFYRIALYISFTLLSYLWLQIYIVKKVQFPSGKLLIRPNRKIGYGHGWSNTSLMLATGERETIFDCNVAMIILGQVNETELRKIVYDAEDRKGSGLRGEMS